MRSPSPNDFSASRIALVIRFSNPSRFSMMAIPRPPPPATAFSITGSVIVLIRLATSAEFFIAFSLPNKIGKPSLAASILAPDLEPSRSMVSALGPIKTRPAASTAITKLGCSDKNPYPG